MKKFIFIFSLVLLTGCAIFHKEKKKQIYIESISQQLPPSPEEEAFVEEKKDFVQQDVIKKKKIKEKKEISMKEESTKVETQIAPPPLTTSPTLKEKKDFSIWNGECLIYKAEWTNMDVGKGMIVCQEENTKYGIVYHLIGITLPEGLPAKLGQGYNRIDSYVDKETFQPYYFYSYIKNGNITRIIEAEFNKGRKEFEWQTKKYRAGELYQSKNGKLSYKDCIYDSFSVFYILRTLNFEEKSEFTIPVGITKIWDLFIKVKGKRKENIPGLGIKEIYEIEPEAKSDEGFFTKGKMIIWVTSDEKKLPVYFLGKMALGTGKMTLISNIKLKPDVKLTRETIAKILSSI